MTIKEVVNQKKHQEDSTWYCMTPLLFDGGVSRERHWWEIISLSAAAFEILVVSVHHPPLRSRRHVRQIIRCMMNTRLHGCGEYRRCEMLFKLLAYSSGFPNKDSLNLLSSAAHFTF
jgi:hypothetical protein